ncbi:MAG: type II toxin-antitoxin system prevent-host-death family antitoxin [SAR324 cluster bacterium]|nr:type II toxin-antitoxin system prevent-host-death family antitoxin [SAR324 cluster bacterium]
MGDQFEVIAISEFKATCLKTLEQVKQTGNSVLVTRRGEPIALVTPPPPPQKPSNWLGLFRNQGEIIGDIISPVLDEKEWEVLTK